MQNGSLHGDRMTFVKIRWREENTPIMKGNMHIDMWIQNYMLRLPRIRKNMMFPIRRRFRDKYLKMVF